MTLPQTLPRHDNILQRVLSIADRLPAARKGTIEIRPILELPNLPYAS